MKPFNVGAMRPAIDGARLSAANDLVHRTLAQHGLVPQSGPAGAQKIPVPPSLNGMLGKLTDPIGTASAFDMAIPKGAQFKQDSFTCPAGGRAYRTYIPASASKGITGVVMMLHGCTQTPEDFATGTGMNLLAEKHRFLVVYPAQSRGNNAQSCWNWFSKGDQRRGKGEPAILAGIASKVTNAHGIGRDQTFVAGLSAGAAMAVILGETYDDVFAAVGAHSGLPRGAAKDVPSAFAAMAGNSLDPDTQPGTSGTPRTIVFHGTADTTVHPSNGAAIARRAMDSNARQSIETMTNGDSAGRRFTRIVFSDLQGKPIVENWVIEGQGHAWSGGQAAGTYTDTQGPDASAEMIRFFFDTTDKDL
ncbi:PHB depolymerase family esterase [Sulfitobacter sp. F26204]|uniref:extracellular catalytic domain type 1 short-chain-length polyhydroxyalkanoate depolymerase n=1 Tax=Sulfitobacter sp. F26204 TaxID=2996014 RepID=UPI00225E697D|nr:PHB depolymerase family esterase [Sulfitobacter sp. F26204]MCX7561308.1 PHB depolymerase family esterase [Sulfitobacter sp. F26204]